MCLVKTLVLNRIEDNVCSGPKVFGYFLFPRQSNVAFALVDCPTQLICTFNLLCSTTMLKEHSREFC